MKEYKNKIITKILKLLLIILLYNIVGTTSIFPFVLSLSLYNIFSSCFSSLSFKKSFDEYKDNYSKFKFLKISLLSVCTLGAIFLILSLLINDISSHILKLSDMFPVFFMMGVSLLHLPFINIITDYLNSTKRIKKSKILNNLKISLESILLIIISILSFKFLKLSIPWTNALLYLPKILTILVIIIIFFIIIRKDRYSPIKNDISINKNNYYQELKKVLTNSYYKSIINIVKNSYYYISIIFIYLILSTRYYYAINLIEEDITFVYFYFLFLINYLIEIINYSLKKLIKPNNITDYLYNIVKIMLPIAIILSVISPLVCKIIFNNPDKSVYLTMLNFMAITIALYNITIDNVKSKKILHISLLIGLLSKVIITIPLINAFYRMGYNLIYGDITSSIISMTISIVIGYIPAKNKSPKGAKYLDKILNILYENIILTIILIILEFIVPLDTTSYLKSLLLIMLYLSISYGFFKIKKKYIE